MDKTQNLIDKVKRAKQGVKRAEENLAHHIVEESLTVLADVLKDRTLEERAKVIAYIRRYPEGLPQSRNESLSDLEKIEYAIPDLPHTFTLTDVVKATGLVMPTVKGYFSHYTFSKVKPARKNGSRDAYQHSFS